jgi:uncharacterized protein YcnI
MPRRTTLTLAAVVTLMASLPRAVVAHAVVTPGEAPAGAYQRYLLRVPSERASATVRVHIVFPAGVRVISFDEVPGWTLETVSSDGGAGYTTATWIGTLPAARFVEFGFIGVNPAEATTLVWPVVQTYADGFLAEWTGPPDSAAPASVTFVRAPAPSTSEAGPAAGGGPAATLLAAAALLVAFVSLGFALRPARGS